LSYVHFVLYNFLPLAVVVERVPREGRVRTFGVGLVQFNGRSLSAMPRLDYLFQKEKWQRTNYLPAH